MKRGLLELSLASWSLTYALQHVRQAVEQLERVESWAEFLLEIEPAIAALEQVQRKVTLTHAKLKNS